jgi:hypothetical protein
VEQTLGVPIPYYLKVSLGGFRHIVDAMGGVEIDVDRRMDYDDNYAYLHIHLEPGLQHLDGTEALGFVRFRHDKMGDLTRIERQKKFMKAVMRQALSPEKRSRLPMVMRAVSQNVRTNLSLGDLKALSRLAQKVNLDQLEMVTLSTTIEQGRGTSYVVASPEQIAKVVNRVINQQGTMIEVVNGTDFSGLASETADKLRPLGFDVIFVGNSDTPVADTQVIYRRSARTQAENIVRTLACGKAVAATASTPASMVEGGTPSDIIVLLGADYLRLQYPHTAPGA